MYIPLSAILPLLITAFCLFQMFRPLEFDNLAGGIEVMLRPLWLIPVLVSWLAYALMGWYFSVS